MKKTNKKGFTLVELLVVIAIVAILATVAIIGYTSFTKKAEISADQQAVVQMNKVLEADAKLNGTPADVDAVKTLLIANDYNGALTTYYSGYKLAWLPTENVIVLVENGAVVYPEAHAGKTDYEPLTRLATDAGSLEEGLKNGETVHVNANITANTVYKNEAGKYALSLNGNSILLNGNASDSTNKIGALGTGTEVEISNGVIDGSAIVVPSADTKAVVVHSKYGASMELSNVQIVAPANANPIQCYGATMVLNNVTVAQTGNNAAGYYNSAIQVVDGYGDNDQYRAHLTVNGGVYTGKIALQMSLPGGTVIINDGIFTGTEAIHMDNNATSYPDHDHIITINGGTFNGTIYAGVNSTIEINGGTFSINPETDITGGGTVIINGTVVDNGNGTWTVK